MSNDLIKSDSTEHFIDIKNYINERTDYFNNYELLLLSELNAIKFCNNQISNYVNVINKNENSIDTIYLSKLIYNENYTYILLIKSNNYALEKNIVTLDYLHLIYKYQDPVVRMICEYMILVNDEFVNKKTNKLNEGKVNEYYGFLVDEKRLTDKERQKTGKFWKYIRNYFIGRSS